MLGNLEESCIIVMDNVTYHSTLTEEYPKANTRKVDVQKWLQNKSMDFNETLSELREKFKLTMPKENKYKLDEITLQMGHEVVRLPPYHCQYNPIELIWAKVKGKVAENNNTYKMYVFNADVEVLVNSALDAVTTEDWIKCGEHCNKVQENNLMKEGLRDKILEPIIITINPDDSSNDDEDDINN
jgi:hypothetical protein